MPRYVALANWTPKGLETIKDGPGRLDDSKQILDRCGAKPLAFYVLLGGPPDVVLVFDAPDDRAASRVGLELAAKGTIRGSVHPTLDEEAYREVVKQIQ